MFLLPVIIYFRISGLPGPGSMMRNGQNGQPRSRLDNSWREGCF